MRPARTRSPTSPRDDDRPATRGKPGCLLDRLATATRRWPSKSVLSAAMALAASRARSGPNRSVQATSAPGESGRRFRRPSLAMACLFVARGCAHCDGGRRWCWCEQGAGRSFHVFWCCAVDDREITVEHDASAGAPRTAAWRVCAHLRRARCDGFTCHGCAPPRVAYRTLKQRGSDGRPRGPERERRPDPRVQSPTRRERDGRRGQARPPWRARSPGRPRRARPGPADRSWHRR